MPEPKILTYSEWAQWLSDAVQGRDDAPMLVWRAEQKVIDRYREHEPGTTDAIREDRRGAWVQLIGWEETDAGDPDVAAMPDDLVTALRDTISRIVTHSATSVDGNIESVSQGSKSVSFSKGAGDLPRSVWAPLRRYDDRTPFHPSA